jgi:hypothetical protein
LGTYAQQLWQIHAKDINVLNFKWIVIQTIVLSFQDCGIPSPVNAKVTLSENKTTYGEIAVVSCNIGYRPDGSTSVTCLANGTWEAWPPCNIIGKMPFYTIYINVNLLLKLCQFVLNVFYLLFNIKERPPCLNKLLCYH